MSLVSKSVVSTLKVVESQIRCTKYFYALNLPLSAKNNVFMSDLYTVMSCIWYDVSYRPELVNPRWVTALCSEPIADIICLLKDIDFWLISQKFNTYGDFKHHLQAVYPWCGQFISPLSGNISSFYNEGVGLPRLRTALRFATRANFPDPLGLEEEAWRAWQETNLTPWNEVNVQREASYLEGYFPRRIRTRFVENFLGRFGPGASADTLHHSILEKYQSVKTDCLLDYVGLKVGFSPHDMPICGTNLDRTGRLLFVPKQLDKLRTVSIEPAILMFYQLGIADLILSQIRKTDLRRHIDLERADLNADLAWLGSLDGSYATIDLSSASDSVKLGLVKALFNKTCLHELLIGTRSRQVLYNGEKYTPEYFAPMGSGLCFPVECLVFASVVGNVMRQHSDRRAWRVYGDDIVVPSDRYDQIVHRLIELGFDVNIEKSFSGPPGFRESCGGDFFLGEPCRPVYISRFWSGLCHQNRHKPSMIESNIDLANRLYQYKQARLRVIEGLLKVKPLPLFDADGESGIFSQQPTNYRVKTRYNEGLQRTEYYTGIIKTRSRKCELEHEGIRLYETLRAMEASAACAERRPISISRTDPPVWTGNWRCPAPGWSERLN